MFENQKIKNIIFIGIASICWLLLFYYLYVVGNYLYSVKNGTEKRVMPTDVISIEINKPISVNSLFANKLFLTGWSFLEENTFRWTSSKKVDTYFKLEKIPDSLNTIKLLFINKMVLDGKQKSKIFINDKNLGEFTFKNEDSLLVVNVPKNYLNTSNLLHLNFPDANPVGKDKRELGVALKNFTISCTK